jgi:predicted nucleic acid-binding protein
LIHLDTSFLIGGLVPGSDRDGRLREWLRSGETLGISAVAWAEFLCGPVAPDQVRLAQRFVEARIPLTEEDAVHAAALFNGSGRRRGSLVDCLIAATAVRRDATLATANPADFRRLRVDGLRIVEA